MRRRHNTVMSQLHLFTYRTNAYALPEVKQFIVQIVFFRL